jgi:hypothetical protein
LDSNPRTIADRIEDGKKKEQNYSTDKFALLEIDYAKRICSTRNESIGGKMAWNAA